MNNFLALFSLLCSCYLQRHGQGVAMGGICLWDPRHRRNLMRNWPSLSKSPQRERKRYLETGREEGDQAGGTGERGRPEASEHVSCVISTLSGTVSPWRLSGPVASSWATLRLLSAHLSLTKLRCPDLFPDPATSLWRAETLRCQSVLPAEAWHMAGAQEPPPPLNQGISKPNHYPCHSPVCSRENRGTKGH